MKKTISLLLCLAVLLGCLAGCGSSGNGLTKLTDYINENGTKNEAGTAAQIDLGAGLKDTIISAAVINDTLLLIVEYSGDSVPSAGVELNRVTNLYLSGDKKGEFMQQNDIKTSSGYTTTSIWSKLEGSIDIESYTVSSEIDGEFSSSLNTTKLTDEFKATAIDGINTGLEALSAFIAEKLELKLSDLGFDKYEIDSSRESAIMEHNAEPDEPEPEPAPITITVQKLEDNSAGTPMIFYNVTNNSDKALEACTLYIVCYDAYGEYVKRYGSGSPAASALIDDRIEAGATAEHGNLLTGSGGTKSVKIAVGAYKLEGCDKVTVAAEDDLNNANLVWIDYPA